MYKKYIWQIQGTSELQSPRSVFFLAITGSSTLGTLLYEYEQDFLDILHEALGIHCDNLGALIEMLHTPLPTALLMINLYYKDAFLYNGILQQDLQRLRMRGFNEIPIVFQHKFYLNKFQTKCRI